jgi:ClpP class serine protease
VRAFDLACTVPWAIQPDALRAILAIAGRVEIGPELIAAAMHSHPEAVAAREGKRLPGSRDAELRDGVAILHVKGPIFRYANLFDDVSGATSVQLLARDFTQALENPNAHAILIHIDSPGGEVSGISEFSEMIYQARARKPITAYVSDLGASAGYFIASAAERIVVADTAKLGSIGVVMPVRDPAKAESPDIEFVSSQSPGKRANPHTKAGQAQYQATVDQLAEIFIAAVARNRGVSPETVQRDFGAGWILIGQAAVDAGMADAVGSYEGTLRELAETPSSEPVPLRSQQPAAAARVVRPRRAGMSFKERFFAWLDSQETTEAAMEPQAHEPQREPQPTTPAPTTVAVAAPSPRATGPDPRDDEMARLRAELNRVNAERIQERAQVFAQAYLRDSQAFPAEEGAIVALYAQLAADDAVLGAVQLTDGRAMSRVGLLQAAYDARPKHLLTSEQLAPQLVQVLKQQETTPTTGTGPMPAERREGLLKASSLGQAVVNGKPHTN